MDQEHATKPKLLLADDSVTIRKVVELTFADEGIDVSAVADAESAMTKFVEIQPDIVLVDVGLSGTSGYQICEMIKQDDATRHIPVLLLVGSFEPFDQDEAERVEADGFLTKPFHSIRDLVARVWDLLGGNSASGPAINEIPPEAEGFVQTPETADIEDLYQSSFAETAEIEEFDTVDDMLGDPAMDDQLIEASYQANASDDRPLEEYSNSPDAEQTKAFDWSPESMIPETDPIPPDKRAFEPKFVFDETDDSDGSDAQAETIESFSPADLPAFDVAAIPPIEAGWEIPPVAVENTREPEQTDITRLDTADPSADPLPAASNGEPRITPEIIESIAKRVVERLSDNVVREIARDAVPRIAEKLIREALEEDRKA